MPYNGQISYERLQLLCQKVGKKNIVLDLSCRKKMNHDNDNDKDATTSNDNNYYVVTDKWQTYTNVIVNEQTLQELSHYCDEFLIHGVDVEGKQCGILPDLIEICQNCPIPVTYAGGIRHLQDVQFIQQLGKNHVDYTIGSALDIFGGSLSYREVVQYHHQQQQQKPQNQSEQNNKE
jgi:phosphoribosylformimino-5-aminoimidazole carboxamide ribotide isomerase